MEGRLEAQIRRTCSHTAASGRAYYAVLSYLLQEDTKVDLLFACSKWKLLTIPSIESHQSWGHEKEGSTELSLTRRRFHDDYQD